MKSYRNALAALVLAFVFSTSAFAGDGVIYTDRTPPPPPPQATGVIYTDIAPPQTNDLILTNKTASTTEGDALTEIALSLLQSMLSLF
jgi:hypothetical protein